MMQFGILHNEDVHDIQVTSYLIIVWPCIINNDSKEESQLDATIMAYW